MSNTIKSSRFRFLPKSYFLDLLRREKYRSDRWNTPLSIAMFHYGSKENSRAEHVNEYFNNFFYPLRKGIRETDALSYLDDGVVGLLLPNTDKEGAQAVIKKVVNGHNQLPFTITTGTYPDHIFQQLLIDIRPSQGADLFSPDSSIESTYVAYPLKRSLDVVGATVALVLLSPIMLMAALAIKLTSSGPIIFRQNRLGEKGRVFIFYKFRSMYCGNNDEIHRRFTAELIKGNLSKANQGDSEKPIYKMKENPRVTWIGRLIRKTSIDELPQLINVLKGEMSLVGPRPPLPYEADNYQFWHLSRILEAKPGITGLWQVEGRSRTTFDEMVRLDIRYIQNCSLLLDLKIGIKTLKVVLQCGGAV